MRLCRSGLEPVHLELVGYQGPAPGASRAKFRLYRALRSLPGLREALSVSIAYVGRRSDDDSR